MANRNWPNGGKLYTPHVKPVLVDCNFIVTSTNGLGITSLNRGMAVLNVFMHTSTTPAVGNGGITNPNPVAGVILVQLADAYKSLYSFSYALGSPNSASDVKIDNSAMTAGTAYTITTLGNASAAKWIAIGVPVGVTPAVGVSFIAASNGGAGNTLTSRVQATAATGSGILSMELVGNPQLTTINPAASANQGYGAQFIIQTFDSQTDVPAITAPADGTLVSLAFLLSDSSVVVNGL